MIGFQMSGGGGGGGGGGGWEGVVCPEPPSSFNL